MTRTIALFATLTLIAFAVAGSATTSATSPPSADMFAIDMKPHVSPANTATSLGPIHPCAAITQDGVLNADEIVIDTIEFDVVASPLGIPAANPMTGYGYTLNWSSFANTISIVSQTPLLIGANLGSSVVNSSDSLPDSDGSWSASVNDTGPIPSSAETGQGVLDRIRLTANGAAPFGVYVLSIASAQHTDTGGQQHTPDSLLGALIEIDGSCGGYFDSTLESQTPVLPTTLAAGFGWQLSIDGVVGNNGPDTYPGGWFLTVTTTLTPPADCTVNGQAGSAQVLNSVPMPQVWSTESYEAVAQINCSNAGPHQVTSEACVSTDPLDIDVSNNCNSVLVNFDVDDSDTGGDGFSDEDEVGTPLCNGINDDNEDDAIVDDGCLGGPPQAGAFSEAQFQIGTNWLVACTPGGSTGVWPADLVIGSIPNSTNIVNIADLAGFVAPVRRLGTSPGDPNFDERYDISPGRGGPASWINVLDLAALVTLKPPVQPFAGTRAFSGPAAC